MASRTTSGVGRRPSEAENEDVPVVPIARRKSQIQIAFEVNIGRRRSSALLIPLPHTAGSGAGILGRRDSSAMFYSQFYLGFNPKVDPKLAYFPDEQFTEECKSLVTHVLIHCSI